MHNRPRPHTQRDTATPHTHIKVNDLTTGIGTQPDLSILSCVDEWAYLVHTHTPADFAALANKYTNAMGSTVVDSSSVAPITPNLVQHCVHGNW